MDVEPNSPAQVRFEECDVARWAVLEPNLADCKDIDDVVGAMATEYQQALGQAGDRPLVVRFGLLGASPAAGALAKDPERVLAEARSLVRAGSAVEKVVLDVSPPLASPTLDPELAARVTAAADGLAGDPEKIREILSDMRRFGLWRLTSGTEIDLGADDALVSLVQRAGRRLTANLEA